MTIFPYCTYPVLLPAYHSFGLLKASLSTEGDFSRLESCELLWRGPRWDSDVMGAFWDFSSEVLNMAFQVILIDYHKNVFNLISPFFYENKIWVTVGHSKWKWLLKYSLSQWCLNKTWTICLIYMILVRKKSVTTRFCVKLYSILQLQWQPNA